MKIRCLVVDDEPLALSLLEGYVKKTPFLEFSGKCSSGFQALEVLVKGQVDLLFLDIQMPGLSGLELSKALPSSVRVIFTTAYPQYALDGFKVDAMDYLVKPFDYPEFLRAASKAHRWFSLTRVGHISTPEKDEFQHSISSLMVKSESRLVGIEFEHILYLESMGDYVKIFCGADKEPIVTQSTLKRLSEKLPSKDFFRVHRSYMVNLNAIKTIERNRIVFGRTYIPVSDSVKDAFFTLLNQRFMM